jgi:hypothetical protein
MQISLSNKPMLKVYYSLKPFRLFDNEKTMFHSEIKLSDFNWT